jgi:hypothetical protein
MVGGESQVSVAFSSLPLSHWKWKLQFQDWLDFEEIGNLWGFFLLEVFLGEKNLFFSMCKSLTCKRFST